jgi:hypothetical protein
LGGGYRHGEGRKSSYIRAAYAQRNAEDAGLLLQLRAHRRLIVDRFGHVHGIWNFDGRSYAWQSPGSTEPKFTTGDPKSAVLYTLAALDQG